MLANRPTRSLRHCCSLSDKDASDQKPGMFLSLDLNKFQFSTCSFALGGQPTILRFIGRCLPQDSLAPSTCCLTECLAIVPRISFS
jgi:hypothetical protein